MANFRVHSTCGRELQWRHGAGNAYWRLAYRAYNGFANHAPYADAGRLRGNGRIDHLFMATGLGIPVSTTHTIMGVGAARRASAVRWNVAQRIVIAWVITMPAAGLVAAMFYELASLL